MSKESKTRYKVMEDIGSIAYLHFKYVKVSEDSVFGATDKATGNEVRARNWQDEYISIFVDSNKEYTCYHVLQNNAVSVFLYLIHKLRRASCKWCVVNKILNIDKCLWKNE